MGDENEFHASYSGLSPFRKGDDPRRGRGPSAGAPNAGRPPDAVRAACRAAFDARVPMLAELADSGPPEIRLRAMEMLARYGLGTSFTLENQERMPGVIILPELELRNYAALGSLPPGITGSSDIAGGEEFECVIEELDTPPAAYDTILPGQPSARLSNGAQENESVPHEIEAATSALEETVDPAVVREVLARRRNC